MDTLLVVRALKMSTLVTISCRQLLRLACVLRVKPPDMGLCVRKHLSLGVATLGELVAQLGRVKVSKGKLLRGLVDLTAAACQIFSKPCARCTIFLKALSVDHRISKHVGVSSCDDLAHVLDGFVVRNRDGVLQARVLRSKLSVLGLKQRKVFLEHRARLNPYLRLPCLLPGGRNLNGIDNCRGTRR